MKMVKYNNGRKGMEEYFKLSVFDKISLFFGKICKRMHLNKMIRKILKPFSHKLIQGEVDFDLLNSVAPKPGGGVYN